VRSAIGIEVDDLPERVHAAVGTARADRLDRMAGDEAERLLDRSWIELECDCDCHPGIGRAVVFDNGGDAPRGRRTRQPGRD
jgi:hypothetical protein